MSNTETDTPHALLRGVSQANLILGIGIGSFFTISAVGLVSDLLVIGLSAIAFLSGGGMKLALMLEARKYE